MSTGTLSLAFVAGMVATINPCGFALLPAYLSYFLGLDDDDRERPANPVTRALAVSVSVTAGFVVVFGVMGIVWSSVSSWLGTRLPWFTIVVGVVLIGLGMAMLRGYEPTLNLPKLQLSSRRRELWSMFAYGVSYAIASLSCTIGVFIAVVSTTLRSSGFAEGVVTFLAYGVGMGVTLSILTVAVALAKQGIVARFRSLMPHMHTISGVLLILAGGFVSYYAWVELQELQGGSSNAVVDAARDLQSDLQRRAEQIGAARLAVAAVLLIGGALALSAIWRGRSRAHPPEPADEAGGSDREGEAQRDGGTGDDSRDRRPIG